MPNEIKLDISWIPSEADNAHLRKIEQGLRQRDTLTLTSRRDWMKVLHNVVTGLHNLGRTQVHVYVYERQYKDQRDKDAPLNKRLYTHIDGEEPRDHVAIRGRIRQLAKEANHSPECQEAMAQRTLPSCSCTHVWKDRWSPREVVL